jgi:predicted phosphodiesterase
MRRTIVLGDLHLVRDTPPEVTGDLVRLLDEHRGARVVVAGDLFDLSADFPRASSERALSAALASQHAARAAFAEHVDRGGELWLLGGNHDAAVGEPALRGALAEALGLRGDATDRLRTSPWFLRDEHVHFEHGHLYDPDNAPAHPLYAELRCLGVHFVEEFIAPTGAFRYLNANDDTPLKLFLRAFSWYGVRAPYVIYRYFHAAIGAMASSGPFFDAAREIERGRQLEGSFAEEVGLPHEVVAALVGLGESPTMSSLGATFQRVYFDRVLATISLLGGLGAVATKRYGAATWALGVGALSMGISWALGYDRYGGTVPERLERGAHQVAQTTGAKLVVLGHAHREAHGEIYANTGSFSFPREAPGRPFLEIEGSAAAPRAVRRYWAQR